MSDKKILGGESGTVPQENISEKQSGKDGVLETLPEQEGETKTEGTQERIEGKYNEILSKVAPQATTSSHTDDDVTLDAKSIGATVDEESKVQKLVDLATTKGVAYAVKVARSLGDYYALDRLHDELVDRLYEGLLAKGLIRND